MKKAPSAFGTSPKYDDSELGNFCRCFMVVFGGGDLRGKVNALMEVPSAGGEELSADLKPGISEGNDQ